MDSKINCGFPVFMTILGGLVTLNLVVLAISVVVYLVK